MKSVADKTRTAYQAVPATRRSAQVVGPLLVQRQVQPHLFLLVGDAQADRPVDQFQDQPAQQTAPDHREADALGLDPQLAAHACHIAKPPSEAEASGPVSRAPTMPAIACTPNTSSVSS